MTGGTDARDKLDRLRSDIDRWDRAERQRLLADHSAERGRRMACLRQQCGNAGHSEHRVTVKMVIGHAVLCATCNETLERVT